MEVLKWSTSVIQLSWSMQDIMCVNSASGSLQRISARPGDVQQWHLGHARVQKRRKVHTETEPKPKPKLWE
jgi:hypothetical protein